MYLDPGSGSFLIELLIVIPIVLIIALAVFLTRASNNQALQAELAYNKILQTLPQDKQVIFIMQYNSVKKNPTSAVLLALFLGGLGIHKFYMGKIGLGVLYLIFCWTYIPAIIAFIEAFTVAGQVAKYNQQKATEIASTLSQITSTSNLNTPQPIKQSSVRLCPKCNLPMEIKVANKGEQQGKRFYVCPNYKQCQQVFPI